MNPTATRLIELLGSMGNAANACDIESINASVDEACKLTRVRIGLEVDAVPRRSRERREYLQDLAFCRARVQVDDMKSAADSFAALRVSGLTEANETPPGHADPPGCDDPAGADTHRDFASMTIPDLRLYADAADPPIDLTGLERKPDILERILARVHHEQTAAAG